MNAVTTVKIRYVTDDEPHSVELHHPFCAPLRNEGRLVKVHYLDDQDEDDSILLSLACVG